MLAAMAPSRTDFPRAWSRWPALLVFGVALAVRLIYLWESSSSPAFAAPIVDAGAYDTLARKLAAGGGVEPRLFWQPLFYPLFLTGLYWLSEGSIVVVKLFQAGLGAVTACLSYLLGARLVGRWTGLVAGGMTALYGPLVFFEGELLATGWAALWSVSLVLLAVGLTTETPGGEPPRRGWASWLGPFVLGVVAALAVLTRPSFLPFVGVLSLWLAFDRGRRRRSWAAALAPLGAVSLGFLLLSVPVALASARITGHFSFLPGSGGLNTYIGNNPDVCETVSIRPGTRWGELIDLPARHGFTGYAERGRFFYSEVWKFFRHHPAAFVGGIGRKGLQFLSSRELPRNIDVYLSREWSHLLATLTWKVGRFGFPLGVVLPLAVVGLAVYGRRLGAPLLLYLLVYPLSVVAVFVTARYRVPIVPVLAVPAAAGLLALLPRGRWHEGAGVNLPGKGKAALLLGALVVVTVPGRFCEEALNMKADFYYCLGYAQNQRDDVEGAIVSYHKALDSDPSLEEVHYNLGRIYSEGGELERAIEHYTRAVTLDPDFALGHNNLGSILQRQGRLDKAIHHFTEAVRADPDFFLGQLNLAKALASAGRPEAAVFPLEAALRLEPGDASAHFLLGGLYLQSGQTANAIPPLERALALEPTPRVHNELGTALVGVGRAGDAVEHFRRATELDPEYLDAYNNAGAALAISGELAGARDFFRRAVALDPGYTDARYNLGRVLLQLGEVEAARQQFRETLRLRPDHPQARRQLQALP